MISSGVDEDDVDSQHILFLIKKHLFKDIPYVLGTALVAYETVIFCIENKTNSIVRSQKIKHMNFYMELIIKYAEIYSN